MSDPVNLWRDIWLGRNGDAEARARVEGHAAEKWPGAKWRPFDDPPVGQRVRLPLVLSRWEFGDTGIIVGLYDADPEKWPRPHDCVGCRCATRAPSGAGWWAMRRDGELGVIPVYPPTLAPEPSP